MGTLELLIGQTPITLNAKRSGSHITELMRPCFQVKDVGKYIMTRSEKHTPISRLCSTTAKSSPLRFIVSHQPKALAIMGSTYGAGGAHIQSLLTSGKFSDLQISCEGREFTVHKAIVCTQSRVISAACEGGFEESKTNVIKIEEFNADTVQMMLEFLYTGDYFISHHTHSGTAGATSEGENGPQPTIPTNSDNTAAITKKDLLSKHLSANVIGDYYGILPLCVRAHTKLKRTLDKGWSPDDFLHLVTQSCTTRRTGDVWVYRLIGEVMGDHVWHFPEMARLNVLDIPGSVLTSVVASTIKQLQPLHELVRRLDLSAVDIDVGLAEAARLHVRARAHQGHCPRTKESKGWILIFDQEESHYNLYCPGCGALEYPQNTPVS